MILDFVKDFFKYIPSKILPGFLSILIIPIMTRIFDSHQYGNYILVMTTISVLLILASDWIGPAIIRFYPEWKKVSKLEELSGTVLALSLFSTGIVVILAYLILFILKPIISDQLSNYLKIGYLVLAVSILYNILLEFFVVRREVYKYTFFSVWKQSLSVLVALLFVQISGGGIAELLWGIFLSLCLMIPFLYKFSLPSVKFTNFSNIFKTNFFSYGFPLVGTNLAYWILSLSDRYIIEYYRGSVEVGQYAISYSLADRSIYLLVSLIITASSPIIMNIWEEKGKVATANFIENMMKIYLIVVLPATVGFSVLSEELIKLLTTESFYEGYKIMPMVAFSIFLFGFQRSYQLGFLFYKKTSVILYMVLTSGIINIILNMIFIPKYGFIAAGISTLVSYIIFTILIIVFSKKYFTWKFPFVSLLKIIFASAIMVIVVMAIKDSQFFSENFRLFLAILGGTIIYFIVLYVLGEINKENIRKIRNQDNQPS